MSTQITRNSSRSVSDPVTGVNITVVREASYRLPQMQNGSHGSDSRMSKVNTNGKFTLENQNGAARQPISAC